MGAYLGFDIGTSGAKPLIIDDSGRIPAEANTVYSLYHPKPLWSEQHPEDGWRPPTPNTRETMATLGVTAAAVHAIGLSGPKRGSVVLDKNQRVIRRARPWNGRRIAAEGRESESRVEPARYYPAANTSDRGASSRA